MPKASMQSSKALQQGFGIQEGIVKVVGARFKIVQRTKKDGSLVTPMLLFQLDVTKCDKELAVINEEEVSQKDFIFCWGSKEAGEDGLHKFAFHPAVGASATDDDPEDQGAEIDTEGNTLVSVGGQTSPFADSDAALFCKALELKGWKPEINDQSYAPNYVGTVMDIKTVTKASFCKQIGVRYQTQEGKSESSDTVWEVVKIHSFPYEGKKEKASKKGEVKADEKPKGGKTNGEAAEGGPEELALQMVKKVAESKDFKGKEGIARSKFQAAVLTQMHRDKKVKEQAQVMKLVKDDEWIVGAGGELNFIVDTDEGLMSFVSD